MPEFIGAFSTAGVRLRAVRSFIAFVGVFCALSGVAAAQALPRGWNSQDVGSPKLSGGALYLGTSFALAGTGADIGGSSDQFRYVYQRVTGDVDIIARVANLDVVQSWTKAGVMVRASLDRRAANGYMLVSAQEGLHFQTRRATGQSTSRVPGDGLRAPVWLKIERRGGALSAFSSRDGATWKFVGTTLVTLPETVYVGLAVTSNLATARAIGIFDRVTVRPVSPITSDPPPDDNDNDDPPPSSGGETTTPPPSSTPPPTGTRPGAIVFTPSSDHATNVTGYRLEISLAAAPSLVLLRIELGKPAVVNGQIQVPMVSWLGNLLPGQYVGVLRAYNAKGISSGASASFAF